MRYIVSCLLLILGFLPALSQILWTSAQERWADTTFGNPKELDEQQLLRHAFHIIDYGLNETSSLILLETLAPGIPELKSYLDLQNTQTTDTLLHTTLSALRALSDRIGEPDSLNTDYLYSRFRIYDWASNVNENISCKPLLELIDKAQKTNTDPDLKALRILVEADSLATSINRKGITTDEDYTEICSLKRRSLSVYPDIEKIDSLIGADLLRMMANLFSFSQDEELAFLHVSSEVAYALPHSSYIGQQKYAFSDSPYLYEKAADIYEKLFNPYHPVTVHVRLEKNRYIQTFMGYTEQVINDLSEQLQYLINYFTKDKQYHSLTSVIYRLMGMTMGITAATEDDFKTEMNELSTLLSPNSSLYLLYLKTFVPMLLGGENPEYWQQLLEDTLAAHGIVDDTFAMNEYELSVIPTILNHDPELGKQKLSEIEDFYYVNSDSSFESYELAKNLSSCYFTIGDKDTSLFILEEALRHLEKKLGDHKLESPLWWKTYLTIGNLQNFGLAPGDHIDWFESALDRAVTVKSSLKEPLIWFLTKYMISVISSSASYLPDIASTLDKYGAYGLSIDPYADFFINNYRAYSLTMQNYEKGFIPDEAVEMVESSLAMLKDINRKGDLSLIRDNDFHPLLWTLLFMNRPSDALAITDLLLQKMLDEGASDYSLGYINTIVLKANILNETGNKSEARRIMAETVRKIQNIPDNLISTDWLDVLWQDYNIAKNENAFNTDNYLYKIKEIRRITDILIERSGHEPYIVLNYGGKITTENLSFCINGYVYYNSQKQGADPDKIKELDLMIDALEIEQIAESAQVLYDEFISRDPDNINNWTFQNLCFAIALYKETVAGDIDGAEELYKLLLNAQGHNRVKVSLLGQLANMAFNRNDIDRLGDYLTQAENLMQTLQDYDFADEKNFIETGMVAYNAKKGDYDKALDYARQNYRRNKDFLDKNFKLMTVAEQNNYLASRGDPSARLCALLDFIPDKISGEVYDAVIYRTGMQLRNQRKTRDAILNSNNPEVKILVDSLESLKRYIDVNNSKRENPLELNNLQNQDTWQLNSRINQEIKFIEQKLLDLTVADDTRSLEDVTWQQVQNMLNHDEAALEFVFTAENILALIVRKDSPAPLAVKVAPLATVMDFLNGLGILNSGAMARELYSNHTGTLYRMLWQPIEPHLNGIKNIYYTLPGILNNLAFNTFTDPSGVPLFDKYDLRQLTTTGQLVFDSADATPQSLAVLGNVQYRLIPLEIPEDDNADRSLDRSFSITEDPYSRDISKSYFRKLPFTATEIENIYKIYSANAVDTVQSYNASEPNLYRLVEKKPDILHLATHGFYIASDKEAMKLPFYKKVAPYSMNRSGFALYGAEDAWRGLSTTDNNADGIVTAEEISLLDLTGTSLVTLSACETALGDLSFEGIFGLQRGFKQAGAKSMLLSLWNVNDKSTSEFMTAFYSALKAGLPKQEAWRQAVETVRKEYPSPYYWAPFVLLDP